MIAGGAIVFVDDAVSQGFVDARDAAAFLRFLAPYLARWGLIADGQVQQIRRLADAEEQKRLVRAYVAFAETTRSPVRRAAKLASLGVPASTMTHWARRLFGPGTLARAAPPSAGYLITEYLRAHPGSTRKAIAAHAGVVSTSIPGALDYGMRHGWYRRSRSKSGLFRWYNA